MGEMSKRIGDLGEDIATKYLENLRYRIIERNFRSQQGEIDIVGFDGEVLAFIEVKCYSFRSYSTPNFAIRKNKREGIIHAARTYLYKKRIVDRSCRFDVLTIYWDEGGGRKVELIKL